MDKIPFSSDNQPNDFMNAINRAQQNPQMFEEQFRRMNPQAYQRACEIRNSQNPRQAILQLAQERGVNPNVLRMFGII
jgi:hypothetical protein